MRPYEVMIIFDADLEDDAVRAALDRFTGLLQTRGATPGRIEWWGKRRFAYEMKHRWEGNYVLLEAEAEPPPMAELDRALFLADEVLRHKIVRIPDAVAERRRAAASSGAAGGPGAPVTSQAANGA
jgi:small subunit ribosomal protein S6